MPTDHPSPDELRSQLIENKWIGQGTVTRKLFEELDVRCKAADLPGEWVPKCARCGNAILEQHRRPGLTVCACGLTGAQHNRIAALEETNRCLVDQASCWYHAGGSIERMDPASVIEKRKAAAKRMAALQAELAEARTDFETLKHSRNIIWCSNGHEILLSSPLPDYPVLLMVKCDECGEQVRTNAAILQNEEKLKDELAAVREDKTGEIEQARQQLATVTEERDELKTEVAFANNRPQALIHEVREQEHTIKQLRAVVEAAREKMETHGECRCGLCQAFADLDAEEGSKP